MGIFEFMGNKKKTAEKGITKGHPVNTQAKDSNGYNRAVAVDPGEKEAWLRKAEDLSHQALFLCSTPGSCETDRNREEVYEEAIQAYDKAIELDPADGAAWSGKGNSLAHLGRYEEAIQAHDKAIELDPKSARFWFGKGDLLVNVDRCEEAIRAYEKALEIDPDCGRGWYNKGKILHDLGRYEEALEAYDRAIVFFPDDTTLGKLNEKCRTLLFESVVTISISCSETGLEYNTWQFHTLTVSNMGMTPLNNIMLSFSGDVEARGIRPFSLSPSERKSYECSLKAVALGTVPVEVAVTAADSAGEKYSATYDYLIPVSDPQRSTAPFPIPPAIEKPVVSPEMFPLERTIYDPVAQDFLLSSERPLVNVRKWIEDKDPRSYWFVTCIHNDSDSPIDEWGVELNSTSSLQVIDACIEGHGKSATVQESHPMPWLSQWVIGVSHHAGIVIPRSGSRRIYVKLGSNACGVSHTIKGRFMTSHGVEVPIREKTFTHSCDIATLRTALSSDPAAAGQYAENIIRRAYDRDTALKLLRSFKLVQEIDQCCTLQKYDEIMNRMQLLAGTLEGIQAGEKLTHLVHQSCDALAILGDSEASVENARRLCGSIVDTWVNEFI